MKTLISFLVVLAFWSGPAAAQDRSDRKDRSEKRDRSDEKSAKPSEPGEPMGKSAGYDVFRNVRTKNIFDPSRRGPRIEPPPGTASSSSSGSRGRSLVLTGTMVTEGRTLAFFGGSAADGSRVISVGNSVANYKVTAIAPTQVSLEHEGKPIVLEVGRQITFGGAPGEAASVGPAVDAAPSTSPSAPGALPPPPPGISGDKSEILRRMMERRAREEGK